MAKQPTTLEALLHEIDKMREHVQWLEKAGNLLQSQEDVYKEMVNSANSIILCWNAQGNVTFINRFALDFFGYEDDEVVGKPVFETIVPPTDTQGVDLKALLNDICQNPEKFVSNENENMKKDGSRVWISWTNKPVYDRHGTFIEILSVGNDITRRKLAEDELARLASTDMLTGVLNRRAGMELLENALKLARRKGYPLSICFVDVNNLKWVNDHRGHHAGDKLIKDISDNLKLTLRASDSVVRLGGDEFLVILPECNIEAAQEQWKRLKNRLKEINSTLPEEQYLSVSYGFAEYLPDQEIPHLREFVTRADENMYAYKQAYKEKYGKRSR